MCVSLDLGNGELLVNKRIAKHVVNAIVFLAADCNSNECAQDLQGV